MSSKNKLNRIPIFMKCALIFLISFSFNFVFSQDYGYFGKKNTFSVNGTGSIPLFYLFRTKGRPNYMKDGKSLKNKNDKFDSGFNFSYSHAFSGKFAFGFEYDILMGNVKAPIYGSYVEYDPDGYSNSYAFNLKHEQLSIITHVFMPKIEYNFTGSELLFGINNQFGIGYTSTSVSEKVYLSMIDLGEYVDPNDSSIIVNSETINYSEVQSLSGITFMYAFNIRTPISKHFMINYGIRYTLNLTFRNGSNTNYNSNQSTGTYYLLDSSKLVVDINSKRISSIMALNIGINYIF